jgi:hypothetical protein
MKKEKMNGVPGLPGAAETHAEDCRQKAQSRFRIGTILVLFALLGGYSINVNPPDWLGFQSVTLGLPRRSRLVRRSRCGEGGCGEGGSNWRENPCKNLTMNNLQNKQLPSSHTQSK